MSDRIPFRVHPMLATLVQEPFDRRGWVFEEKYDGYRILAYKEGTQVTLLSRNSKIRTHSFAAIAQAVAMLASATLLLDGEVVSLDPTGVSRFQRLQNLQAPPGYAVFDCLYKDGRDLRDQPLSNRRAALEDVVASTDKHAEIFLSARLSDNGLKAYQIAKQNGYEGVLAKDASSPYIEGRSGYWLKFKVHQEDEFVVVGYTAPAGSRKYFGALLLAAYDNGKLVYVGKVGTGFSNETLAQLHKKFQSVVRGQPPLPNPPRERNVTYLAPKFVAQIAYGELTADRKLRQPVFLGLRDDKRAQDVLLPEGK
ncbi:MAG: non-homologous end-joining DNA ligase [Acidobacteriaceae bacterium]|nr:non-homologous end-joining DNA ligase [Acidobacteriaceae bacterium]MBV8570284.1 non-homologous end-joining DNA ligase [Acidobacteriaceae bacterium]